MKITFLGATELVTGSKYLIEEQGTKILVDCGLFQGSRALHMRNYEPLPVDPKTIDAVIITHAHVDHTGYIPALIKNGFKGAVYCSPATAALCSILLVDCGMIFEEEARKIRDDKKSSTYREPLYTVRDAQHALPFFHPIDYDTSFTIGALHIKLIRSGHILGSAFVIVSNGEKTLSFSGDLGRPDQLIMKAPPFIQDTDYLVLESTYGNRLHTAGDPIKALKDLAHNTVARGGVTIIPAFAVERTQMILYCLYQLKQQNAIPEIPIFLDSPMAIKVTDLYCNFSDEHTIPLPICKELRSVATYTTTVEESKRLNNLNTPAIIIAGSGMATGGRVLHHFKHYITNARNTIAFVGYQAEGSYGRALIDGAQEIKIEGGVYQVRATIELIDMFSAHADYQEILDWLEHFKKDPKMIFLTHGQKESALALQKLIEDQFKWSVVIPKFGESFELD